MDKFTTTRLAALAGVKFKPEPALTEEQLAEMFNELFDLLEQYESAELLEHIASLDLAQLDEGFWGNVKDAAKGVLGVAKDAKDAIKQKVKDKTAQVATAYNKHKDAANSARLDATAAKMYSLMKSDFAKYIAKIEAFCKKEFEGEVPNQAKGVMKALQVIIDKNLKGVK